MKKRLFTEEFYSKLEQSYVDAFSNLNNVNYGGCGWSAYVVCKILRSKGIPAEIYFQEYAPIEGFIKENGVNFDKACKKVITTKRGWKIPNNHIMVKVGDRYFDSDGEFNKAMVDTSTRTSLFTLKRALKEACWNQSFACANSNLSKKKVDTIRKFSNLVDNII